MSSIMITTNKVDLRQQPESGSDSVDFSDDSTPSIPQAPGDPVAAAIVSLAARVEATRRTLRWIGGFIVFGLLFIALR